MNVAPFTFTPGDGPLLISAPHAGTHVPPDLQARMTAEGRAIADTDWNIDQLYHFARAINASLLVATHSRYVIDLNRPPDGKALYPGQRNTGLCPVETFDGAPLWQPGQEPTPDEIDSRRRSIWQPYHDRIADTLAAAKARHGHALLWDAHSIRGRVPQLFDGRLPDFNIGTNDGATCPDRIANDLACLASEAGHTAIVNGRFKGGYITRHYGNPAANIFAVQLELVQDTYMLETPPWTLAQDKARSVSGVIERLVRHFAAAFAASR